MMKTQTFALCLCAAAALLSSCGRGVDTVSGFDDAITFIGRVDRTDSLGPRQWGAGAYFTFAFDGAGCDVELRDERLYGNSYNYLEVVIDGESVGRFRTLGAQNRLTIGRPQTPAVADTAIKLIAVADSLAPGRHTVLIARDTESAMGYTQLCSVSAPGLEQWRPEARLKMEFIGNSITSGMDCYTDEIPYGQGVWYDRHRAYYAYGPRAARALGAEWSLASVSGIGLMHSCCDHKYVMPQIYDKVDLVDNKIGYDFAYQPDVVVCALGQNDGEQDSTAFATAYVDFIRVIRQRNGNADIALISSPMANDTLRAYFRKMLPAIAAEAETQGLAGESGSIPFHIYEKSYNGGGSDHPSMDEQAVIADELVAFLRETLAL